MEDHSPEFQLFMSIFSQCMAFPRCVPNVHHFVASKPVLVWQSFESLLYTPLSGWLLFLLWWQFSVLQLFVDFPGIRCLWGNPIDKNLGGRIWWVRGPFHIASSAYESLFKPLPQPSNSFVGCMRCGPVLLKPLWSSHNPSPASQRCPVLVQNSYVALLVDCLGLAVIIFEPKRPGDPVLAHGHPGSIFNGMKRPLKHFFWNLGTPKNIVFTKRSQESFHHFQAHCRTIHTLLLAFPCQHQLIFALFGSCMGIGADQT